MMRWLRWLIAGFSIGYVCTHSWSAALVIAATFGLLETDLP